MNVLINKLIAHRGLYDNSNGIPENSLIAFAKAVEEDLPIELDVQILKDGTVVVFHDSNLKRLTGVDKILKTCNIKYLNFLRLLNTEYTIPTIDDVLNLVRGRVPLIIETKNSGFSKKLEKTLLKKLEKYNGQYVVESFNPFSVWYIKRKNSKIYRGMLVSDLKDVKMSWLQKLAIKNMWFRFLVKPEFISYDIRCMPNQKLQKLRKSGIYVFGWTLKSKQDYLKSKDFCDSYIFENIGLKRYIESLNK